MTARIGAGDTELGRRIRDVQDLSERILQLHADDQKIARPTGARCKRANPAYSAALEEFRAASIASARDRRRPSSGRRELARQLPGLLAALPAGTEEGRLRGERKRPRGDRQGAGRAVQGDRRRRRRDHGHPRPHGGGGEGAARLRRVHGAPHRAARRHRPLRGEVQARRALRSSAPFPAYVALADPKPLRRGRGAGAAEAPTRRWLPSWSARPRASCGR